MPFNFPQFSLGEGEIMPVREAIDAVTDAELLSLGATEDVKEADTEAEAQRLDSTERLGVSDFEGTLEAEAQAEADRVKEEQGLDEDVPPARVKVAKAEGSEFVEEAVPLACCVVAPLEEGERVEETQPEGVNELLGEVLAEALSVVVELVDGSAE